MKKNNISKYLLVLLCLFQFGLIAWMSKENINTYDVLSKSKIDDMTLAYKTGCLDLTKNLNSTDTQTVGVILNICEENATYYKLGLQIIEAGK